MATAVKPGTNSSAETAGNDLHLNYHLVDEMVAKARAMRPLLEANATRHEELGELTPEVVAALEEARMFWMAGPERIGGLALPSAGQGKVVAEIAKGCPSTAWTLSIINSCVWLASAMSFEMQDYIFPDKANPPKVCAPTNGAGTLVAEGDHWILNGKWAYGSGSHHSRFALVPAEGADGSANFVALPLADARIVNTWHVAGMKGTGSDTVVAENVRIEKNQFTEIAGVGDTASLHVSSNGLMPDARKAQLLEATDYWVGLTLLRSKSLSIVLGTVQGLMDVVLKTREKGIMFTTYEKREDSQVFQTGIGECHARLQVVQSILDYACGINDVAALEGRALTEDEKIRSRGHIITGIKLLTDVTTDLMDLCGTSGFASVSPAQRYWRDFMVGSRHAMFAADPGHETIGKYVMRIEPNITPATLY